jgi:hypothetical protein
MSILGVGVDEAILASSSRVEAGGSRWVVVVAL